MKGSMQVCGKHEALMVSSRDASERYKYTFTASTVRLLPGAYTNVGTITCSNDLRPEIRSCHPQWRQS
jgi:hypothetical protein